VVACVNDVFFTFFCSNTTLIYLFINSYCHHFGGSFMVELHFYYGHYWGQQQHLQQQQTNNIMMSSCTFGKLLFTLFSWMFVTILGIIHSWVKFKFYIFTFLILKFVTLPPSFFVEIAISPTKNIICTISTLKKVTKLKSLAKNVAKLNDVFLYIRKSTFYTSFMDVFNNIGNNS
jgi:hypothetical protein